MSWRTKNNKSEVGGGSEASAWGRILPCSLVIQQRKLASSARHQQVEYTEAGVDFVRFPSEACPLWSSLSNWKSVMSHSVCSLDFCCQQLDPWFCDVRQRFSLYEIIFHVKSLSSVQTYTKRLIKTMWHHMCCHTEKHKDDNKVKHRRVF